jgi:hypothetical protein
MIEKSAGEINRGEVMPVTRLAKFIQVDHPLAHTMAAS